MLGGGGIIVQVPNCTDTKSDVVIWEVQIANHTDSKLDLAIGGGG